MTKRFRMIAGPNGSGKSTLVGLLRRDYAVNFYTMLNADEILAEVSKTRAYLPALPVAIKCNPVAPSCNPSRGSLQKTRIARGQSKDSPSHVSGQVH